MRVPGRLGAELAGIGVVVACCALGPAAILAGVGVAVAGLGVGAWIAIIAGLLLAAAGTLLAVIRRRRPSRRASCSLAGPTEGSRR